MQVESCARHWNCLIDQFRSREAKRDIDVQGVRGISDMLGNCILFLGAILAQSGKTRAKFSQARTELNEKIIDFLKYVLWCRLHKFVQIQGMLI